MALIKLNLLNTPTKQCSNRLIYLDSVRSEEKQNLVSQVKSLGPTTGCAQDVVFLSVDLEDKDDTIEEIFRY